MSDPIYLSDGEWKIMNLLWGSPPRSGAELAHALAGDTGWSRATVHIMLGRLAEKGAVRAEGEGRARRYAAAVPREQATAGETTRFLERVYQGSLRNMVASMAGQGALSRREIDELRAILQQAEQEVGDE